MNAADFPETQLAAFRYFADELNCHEFMAGIRWKDGKPNCPFCKSDKIGNLVTTEHKSRTKKEGVEPKTLTRRFWVCKECRKQFSVKVGSLFEDSPLALDKWLCGLWLIVNAKNGISSCEVGRTLGITQKSAWFLCHRLRMALHAGSFEKFSGTVEADESFIGGVARNMHRKRQKAVIKGSWNTAQTPVQGLLQRDERKGHSKIKVHVVRNTGSGTLQKNVRDYVLKGSKLMTDAHSSYRKLKDEFEHKFVDHAVAYVNGNVHTNGLENFWTLLKRTIKGTYVNVEPFHLFRYLDEQSYRFNERSDEQGDKGRFLRAIKGIVGKRLTWDKLTGKDILPECLPAC